MSLNLLSRGRTERADLYKYLRFWGLVYSAIAAYFGFAILLVWLYRVNISGDPSRDFAFARDSWTHLYIFWGHYSIAILINIFRPNVSLLPFALPFPIIFSIYASTRFDERLDELGLFLTIFSIGLFFYSGIVMTYIHPLYSRIRRDIVSRVIGVENIFFRVSKFYALLMVTTTLVFVVYLPVFVFVSPKWLFLEID